MFQRLALVILFLGSQALAEVHDVRLVPSKAEGRPSERRHEISPYIYGFGSYLREDRSKENVFEMRPTLYRFGGNTSSRYSYKTNSWNAAQDWYFRNLSGGPKNVVDAFMQENRERGIATAITVPMLGWVAKDGTSVSFPKSLFPKQDAFDQEAGNGKLNGKALKADPKLTSVPITPAFVEEYVTRLKNQFGPHPHFYIMDNEPMLWHETHRDVHPMPLSYDEFLKRYISYAKAVRKADPKAVIVGPAAWGWMEMQNSAMDIEGPWNGFKKGTDRKAHGDKPLLEWFLQEIAREEKKLGVSLLDVIDVHYYPEKGSWPKDESSEAYKKQLLRSTRSLFDPDYKDESWIADRIALIPRLRELAARYKPKAKVSLGEYNFRSEKDASGAIAQADILGIMASEDLYSAQYWDFPIKDGTHRNAFLLYRNFDGQKSGFGEVYLPNSIGNQAEYSVYAAEDKAGRRLTFILINKSMSKNQKFLLNVDEKGRTKDKMKLRTARIAGFEDGGTGGMRRFARDLKDLKKLEIETKPLSMQIVELNFGQ